MRTLYDVDALAASISGVGKAASNYDMLAAWRTAEATRLSRFIDRWLATCESHIERIMMLALLRMLGFQWNFDGVFSPECSPFAEARDVGVRIYCQFKEGTYRLDFAIIGRTFRIALEVDGHDFHERTKEQAARDKARDRRLTLAGWKVLRFTGSEVWRAAADCVDQVADLIRHETDREEDSQ